MAQEKMIIFTLQNGEVWGLPLQIVAANRARYYEENDPDTSFASELEFVMNDDYEGIDWFRNNMNPSEVKEHFKLLNPAREQDFDEKFDSPEEIRIACSSS